MVNEEYLTPIEIAKQLKITERTVYRWLDAGDLRGVKLGRVWRVRRNDLEKFLTERENSPE